MSDNMSVGCRITSGDLEFYDKASGLTVLAFRNGFTSNPVFSAVNGLTAKAGGGQSGATPITALTNRFTTVASGGDSAILPVSAPLLGMDPTVINAGAQAMNIFPAVGEAINALAANAAFSIPAGKIATFFCAVSGTWHALLSA